MQNETRTIRAGIIGDGYTSAELNRLLAVHPCVKVVGVTSIENIGKPLADVFAHLTGCSEVVCEKLELESFLERCDVLFIALPHGLSVPLAKAALERGKKVVDLGADFRFKDKDVYAAWYHCEHEAPELLAEAVYGLPELFREEIRRARLVANPGCYPTGAILGLAPALKNRLLDLETLIIDAKSGVSGAGRTLSLNSHFCEVNENIKAYSIGTHRHTPEIEQVLSWIAGEKVTVSFTPHLIPVSRGILSTIYGRLACRMSAAEVQQIYEEFYRGEVFVHVLKSGQLPQTRAVYSSNRCHIGLVADERTGRLVVVTAIDNLAKGASGQAIQNMNLMFGLAEGCGLLHTGLIP